MLAVNVTGSYLMLRAAAARMTPQQVGRIVNISSITAFDGGGTYSKGVYAIAKAVVVGMCRGGAGELGPYGITVNVIAPVQVSAVKAALTAPRAHGGAVRGRPDAALPGRAACRSRAASRVAPTTSQRCSRPGLRRQPAEPSARRTTYSRSNPDRPGLTPPLTASSVSSVGSGDTPGVRPGVQAISRTA